MERDAAVLARKWKESSASLLERDNEAGQKKKRSSKGCCDVVSVSGLTEWGLTFVTFLKKRNILGERHFHTDGDREGADHETEQ